MARIRFIKGRQRVFFNEVIKRTSSPSLRALGQFGINVNYSTLKNYYNEDRLLPESLFLDLCELSNISMDNLKDLSFERIPDTWGNAKGGRMSKRK